MTLVLHSFWRASAPYRVRIGLNLKGLTYRYAPVDLAAGAQADDAFGAVNAQHLVPALEVDGRILTQSLSIRRPCCRATPLTGRRCGRWA